MARKRNCPACGGSFLRGRRVIFAARTGSRPALVCIPCATAGTTVVNDRSHDFEHCVLCETRAALYCGPCLKAASEREAERTEGPPRDDSTLGTLARMVSSHASEIAERLERGEADGDDRAWTRAVLAAAPEPEREAERTEGSEQ